MTQNKQKNAGLTPGKARLWLMISMVIFGTIGLIRAYIPLASAPLAFFRGLIGLMFLLALLFLRGERISWNAVSRNLAPLTLSGALLGLNWILLFEAYRYTSVATATLCYYMAPVLVLLASPLLLKERLTLRKALCAGVACLGMALISGVFQAAEPSGLRGMALGLGAAVFYAGLMLVNQKLRDISVWERTILQLGCSCLVMLPYLLITGQFSAISLSLESALPLLIVGVVHTGVAYALYFGSMRALPAQTVAQYSYVDPIVAVLLSALLLGERLGMAGWVGAALILGATWMGEHTGKKEQTPLPLTPRMADPTAVPGTSDCRHETSR